MKNSMTRESASRIQSAACKNSGGTTPPNSFASRAMSAAYRNEPINNSDSTDGGCCSSCGFFAKTIVIGAGLVTAGIVIVIAKAFGFGNSK